MKTHVLAASLALILAGCYCTELGCSDYLSVELQNVPAGDLEVLAEDDSGAVWSCDSSDEGCTADTPIGMPVYEVFSLTVKVDGVVVHQEDLEPDYERYNLNGPTCPGGCVGDRVTVVLP